MLGQMRDIGAWLLAFLALVPAVITAGAGNDGVEVDGPYIDMTTVGEGIIAHGGVLFICWQAVLDAAETLTLAANMQDATDVAGTGVADFGDALASAVVATGGGGGTTETGVTELRIQELNGNRGAIRAQVTADLSRAGTDTVALAAVFAVGPVTLPATSGLQSSV